MRADAGFQRAVGAVADGRPVDWDAVARLAPDAKARERVQCLRVLGEIGDLHRSTEDPAADEDLTDTSDADHGPSHAPHWGRYELVEKVGTGGFGQVYRAWDPELQRELAVKILHDHIADDGSRQRLRREGRALARISQPNVVRVLGVEVHEGRAALAMEFVRGQTLDDVVRARGPFSAREAVIIGEDVCRALSAVHRAGYLHRDVKATNVMREQAGRVVLMDFGTGREERQTDAGPGSDMAGTPLYMAPEVLAGRPASMQSDIYSVGVLLFYLVTGGYPVQARSTSELKAAHREGRRRVFGEWRSDLPASFVRVVERALAPEPEARYPNAGVLLEALGSVLAEEEPPPSWVERWLRRMLTLVPLTVLAVVALGALTSVAFDTTLGRSGFATETLWERTVWGLRSCVLPAFILLLGWLAQALAASLRRVIIVVSRRARAVDERIRTRLALRADPSVLASAVLIASVCGLSSAWAYFWPLLNAMASFVGRAPAGVIALLSPAHAGHHDLYRQVFSALTVGTLAAWYLVARLAAHRRVALSRSVVAGVAAVACLSAASLAVSYRLLIHNKFEAVRWFGETCYVTGERDTHLLLFCPSRATDRNQVVPRLEPELKRLGRRESLFTGLPSAHPPATP